MSFSLESTLKKAVPTLLAICLFLYLLNPFFKIIIWSALFAILLYPIQTLLRNKLHINNFLATFITLIGFSLFILLPVTAMIYNGIIEIKQLDFNNLKNGFQHIKETLIAIPHIGSQIQSLIQPDSLNQLTKKALNNSADYLQSIGSFFTAIPLAFILTFLLTFQALHQADLLKIINKKINASLSLPNSLKVSHIIESIRSIAATLLISGLFSLVVMSIVYSVAGLSSPLLLGMITGFVALIPFMLPIFYLIMFIVLALNKMFFLAVVIVSIGVGINLFTDNILQPYMLKNKISIGFTASFIGIIAGLHVFGFIGIFLGPIIINIMKEIAEYALRDKATHS